jgi:lipopolysaccharide exporter
MGAGWLMGWRMLSRLLGIANTVVLVRLLSPADFGLVALATSFSLAIDSVSYLGVPDALVRERTLDRTIYDTGFTMGVLRGGLSAVVIGACAWPAAHFFGDPRLTTVFLVLALGVFLSSLDNIGTVDFQRELRFGRQVGLLLIPRLASILVTMSCAIVWHSYWALIAGFMTTRACRMALSYVVHPFRPRITLQAWRRLIGFSFWSWALSMTNLLQSRSDTIILGSYLATSEIGIYSIGGEIGSLVATEIMEPVSRALFAGFASARRVGDEIRSAYVRAISTVALITLPASAGMALIAQPMMHVVFGPRWNEAVPLVQIFAFVSMLRVGAAVSGALLTVDGLVNYSFRIEFASAILRLLTLLVLVPRFGLLGAAAGVAATGLVEEAIYLFVTARHVKLRMADFVSNLWRPTLAAGVMAIVLAVLGFDRAVAGAGWLEGASRLAGAITIGAAVYVGMLGLAWVVAGRPRGGETYLVTVARQMLGRTNLR